MPNYYGQQAQMRGPVLAEEQPDFRSQIEQERQLSQNAQEQIRRAGDLATRQGERLSEDFRALGEIPGKALDQYRASKELAGREQERTLRAQSAAEESKMRGLQMKDMERRAALDEQFAAKERQTALAQSEAQQKLMGIQNARAQMEQTSFEKWHTPGSAQQMFPEYQAEIAKNKLPPDISAADFMQLLGHKMDVEKFNLAKQEFEHQKQMMPMQIKQMQASINALVQQGKQSGYAFNRQQMQDTVGDMATRIGSLRAQAADASNPMRAKEAQQMLAQVDAGLDPTLKPLIDAEVTTRRATSDLQRALSKPTLDPMGYAAQQKGVADFGKAVESADTLKRLGGLISQYNLASGYLYDTEDAMELRRQIASIAQQAGHKQLASDIVSGATSGAFVSTSMKRLLGIVGGQARTEASLGSSKEAKEVQAAIEKYLIDMQIPVTDSQGHATASALSQKLQQARTKQGIGGSRAPTVPAQTPQAAPNQQNRFGNRSPVPFQYMNKGG